MGYSTTNTVFTVAGGATLSMSFHWKANSEAPHRGKESWHLVKRPSLRCLILTESTDINTISTFKTHLEMLLTLNWLT
jgi:hypothetical protein